MELFEDRIAVRADAPDEVKSGEIIKMRIEPKLQGVVVACGPGAYNALRNEIAPMNVKVGDVIIYGKYTGGDIVIDDESLLLMRQCDVVAVVSRANQFHESCSECGVTLCGGKEIHGVQCPLTPVDNFAPHIPDHIPLPPSVAHIAPRPIDPRSKLPVRDQSDDVKWQPRPITPHNVNVDCDGESCGLCPRCCAIYDAKAQNLQDLFEDDNES